MLSKWGGLSINSRINHFIFMSDIASGAYGITIRERLRCALFCQLRFALPSMLPAFTVKLMR